MGCCSREMRDQGFWKSRGHLHFISAFWRNAGSQANKKVISGHGWENLRLNAGFL
jgi:hypothetical protein